MVDEGALAGPLGFCGGKGYRRKARAIIRRQRAEEIEAENGVSWI